RACMSSSTCREWPLPPCLPPELPGLAGAVPPVVLDELLVSVDVDELVSVAGELETLVSLVAELESPVCSRLPAPPWAVSLPVICCLNGSRLLNRLRRCL